MRLVFGAATDVGRVRERNDDGYLVDESIGLFALADGMGGHRSGDVASATALETLRAAIGSGNAVREAIEDANHAVYAKSLTDSSLLGMGTTLTAGTLVSGGTLLIGHVGDSRAYLLRDGELRQITTDHSHVEELVRDGKITEDEASVHPMRSVITRAIGIEDDVDVDMYPVELHTGDRVLLCSDGLTDMLHGSAIEAELRREPDVSRAATRLVDAANNAGGIDNITVVVIGVTDEEPRRDDAAIPALAAVVAEPEAEPETGSGSATAPAARGRTRRWGRVALWVIPVILILAVAVGAVGWYARKDYFVGLENSRVTVFKGVPGGLFVWDPTVERKTTLDKADLRPAELASVNEEPKFTSLEDANAYVARLRARSKG
ncbi:MAG: Stp1/IreP family PP2C-type Ser/Thr phosphatase [Acidimicrobiia bacterium]